MRAAGYEPEDFEGDAVEVWPENWPAFQLFARLGTQWTVGFRGREGLRYEALFPLMDRMGLSADEWDQMFSDIRHLESCALEKMREEQ
jgi:hypothetical protein